MGVDELRAWLSELHIEGWRSDLVGRSREVLDLLELTRTPRQSLLRTLLESGSGEVTVWVPPEAGTPVERQLVELQTPDRATVELTVVAAGQRAGVVGAGDHTDVLDGCPRAGLDVAMELSGSTLTFRVVDP